MIKTFTTVCGNFTITCKEEFFHKTGDAFEKENMYELCNKYELPRYLHNETGPALVDNYNKIASFFVNGKLLSEEQAKEIIYTQKFNDKLEDLLNK